MPSRSRVNERRVLIVVGDGVDAARLRDAVGDDAGDVEVRLLLPLPKTAAAERRRSRAAAERRLRTCLAALDALGVGASGNVRPSEPLEAIEETLREFAADEIVIASPPSARSRRAAASLADRIVDRFRLPVAYFAPRQPQAV